MKFSDLRIGRRMGAAFAVLQVFIIAVTLLGIGGMEQIHSRLTKITGQHNVEMRLANNMRVTSFERVLAMRNMQITLLSDKLSTDVSEEIRKARGPTVTREIERIRKERTNFKEALQTLERAFENTLDKTPGERALVARIAELDTQIVPLEDSLFESIRLDRDLETSLTIVRNITTLLRSSAESTTVFGALVEKQTLQAVADAQTSFENSRLAMYGLSAAAILIGALFSWMVAGSITRPINSAVKVARTVARGDLTSQIQVRSNDETGQLLQALIDMTASLAKIVTEVRSGTHSIGSSAQQIVDGNHDLSSRTEQQASSLEETASTMEELTSTVRQNAESARMADQLVASASSVASKGGEAVAQVVQNMSSIDLSAHKIVDIISVIDGIAFQTNILALNAAVEAARAGEQGRGFAVVAAEVRSLAQRSAAAAKEIKTLIDDSVTRVEAGSKLVKQAGKTMEEIGVSIKRVSDIMSEIAYASQEQTSGIEQVNRAIAQIDQVTQQNASLVEEAATAAHSMQDLSDALMASVSQFKLDEGAEAEAPIARAARAALRTSPRKPQLHSGNAPKRVGRPSAALARNDDWEEF